MVNYIIIAILIAIVILLGVIIERTPTIDDISVLLESTEFDVIE